jgi:hypothetical protein
MEPPEPLVLLPARNWTRDAVTLSMTNNVNTRLNVLCKLLVFEAFFSVVSGKKTARRFVP